MLYLTNEVVRQLQPSWHRSVQIIKEALAAWSKGDFSQPIKPYLRYGSPQNRIIAMPAFIGGNFQLAGIKWIASFPSNLQKNLPRAHSVIILNEAETGKPFSIINSGLISGIRTAAVSGLLLHSFLNAFPHFPLHVGICGYGAIGRLHAHMVEEILGYRLNSLSIFDKERPISDKELALNKKWKRAASWQEAYESADLFITCTTVSEPYIDLPPKKGSLHLNVSLRDYSSEIIHACPHIFVDDWDEVCRENTNIERTHKKYGLNRERTQTLASVIEENYFQSVDKERFKSSQYGIFNPMGMALFDLAIASYYYAQALNSKQGLLLND